MFVGYGYIMRFGEKNWNMITDEIKENAIRLREEGISISEISRRLGVSCGGIYPVISSIILSNNGGKLLTEESQQLGIQPIKKNRAKIKRREEMGEDGWAQWQKERKCKKSEYIAKKYNKEWWAKKGLKEKSR